jgi:hypothetical protein
MRLAGTSDQILQAALDIPSDATSFHLELAVKGDADALFEVPRLSTTPAPIEPPKPLKAETIAALETLAQLVGYLRFFHPSDEVATIDWTSFEAEAARRVLAARDRAEAREVLRWMVATAAPTARIYDDGQPRPPIAPPRESGSKLTRWVRIGSGDNGNPYSSFRTGINEPSDVGIMLLKTVAARGCKRASVTLATKTQRGSPPFELYIFAQHGSGTPGTTSRVVSGNGTVEGDVPAEATEITFGVRIGGEGLVDLLDVKLECDKKQLASFSSIASVAEVFGTAHHLYSNTPSSECSGCVRLARSPETTYEPTRDEIDVSIGSRLRLLMPLAVWTDGTRTFPRAAPALPLHTPAARDMASRVASVIDIWSTLRWFYPYFDDLGIDWQQSLAEGITAAAAATSSEGMVAVLGRLVARLRDDHASVYRPTYDNGVIPLTFQLLDSKLYIVNGIGDYKSIFPTGSVLESLDGEPADVVIERLALTISAATPGWAKAYLPLTLGDGHAGQVVAIRVRRPDGKAVTVGVPRVARSKYIGRKRADRPASGNEIAPGIFYVDCAKLDKESWRKLLPTLVSSRGLVVDLRGGASPASFQILAHLIDHEIKSPYWDVPIAHPIETRYERSQSTIYPSSPRLSAKVVFVVDGSTASSPETILQYARGAGLGTVVGEPTGGTNGDVASFDSLGGLRVRFTGTRTINQDGSRFHAQGIIPDVIVNPTVDAVRAGRDELIEAAVARLVGP